MAPAVAVLGDRLLEGMGERGGEVGHCLPVAWFPGSAGGPSRAS